jgi:hypothetical protein
VVLVLEDVDRHPRVSEGLGDGVHLGQGLRRRRVVGLPLRDIMLERVVGRRGGIRNESFRTDQDDS